MNKERELLAQIMRYFAEGDIAVKEFEMSSDIAETLHNVQELLAQPQSNEQDLIRDIEYLITAFEDGADAEDYWRPICDLRDDLKKVTLYENKFDNKLAFEEASNLARALHKKFYKDISPNFELCDSTAGVISQIDNMVCTLVEAQPKQEPLELAEVMRKEARYYAAAQFNEGLRVGQREAKRMLLEIAQVKQDYLNENEILTNLLLEAEDKIQELLAQPAPSKPDWVNYRQGVEDAKPKPLSNEWLEDNIGLIHRDVSFTDLVRAVEKAHGIGGEK